MDSAETFLRHPQARRAVQVAAHADGSRLQQGSEALLMLQPEVPQVPFQSLLLHIL